VQPTVFDNVTPTCAFAREEIFGPVLSVMRVKDFEEAMTVANDTEFGLSFVDFHQRRRPHVRFVDEIETG
jgi:aldehyde dehydrogenase (NAD+)